ncbi:RING-H2 finger protein ATL20-like [Syzygium oleosum]|uniref:RING-H2 finger protein ATL20-like n=1 Tax=Syzygium oleosum TaxID=219896 RepID=UPI0011D2A836|nr:RING-H2 finger protein ATL20-like [Syzygium oleosum]
MGWLFSEDSISLTWDLPECRLCEASGGRCGPKGSTDSDFGCIHKHGLSKQGKYWIIRGISISVIVCLFVFGCHHRSCARAATSLAPVAMHRGERHVQNNNNNNNNVYPSPSDTLRGAQHDDDDRVMGLDWLTIESYPKVQVDDEGRVPRPNDNFCVICLSEYQPKDMLRAIPECAHYFHAHCIDQWLKRNASCPLCRDHQG